MGVVRLSGMDSELPPTLRNLARQQQGVISRSQALRAGLSADMIKFRMRGGWWQPVYRGVYLTFTGAPGHSAQLWAALLGAGPGAVLSHETAAELQRLSDRPAESIHVTVPWQRRIKVMNGVSLHRCTRAGEILLEYSNPPLTRVEETVLDLTQAAATFDDVCGWVTRAFARELTDAATLRTAMCQRTRLRWRAELHELVMAAASGDHSVLEYRYGRDVERAHGLPESVRQAPFEGRPGGADAAIASIATTAWWSSWTAGLRTRSRPSGATRPATTRPPRTASTRSATDGCRSPGTPARRRRRSPGSCGAAAGPVGPGHVRPAAPSPAKPADR